MSAITIACDVMSGDNGLLAVIPAVLQAIRNDNEIHFVLVGRENEIQSYFTERSLDIPQRVSIVNADDVVTMDDDPVSALRNKKKSSMRVAIDLVGAGEADAVVSAGNTGALVAISRYVLKMIPGIKMPALGAKMPTISGRPVRLLDMGATLDCSAQQLLQFAMMGTIVCQVIDHLSKPTVALLNIGSEDIKGNQLVKESRALIEANPQINYTGYVEGNEVLHGNVDVIVCDGFVGNVVLKTAEGVSKTIFHLIKEQFHKTLLNKIKGLFVRSVFKPIATRLDPDVYNGTCLLGLRGIVVKSHGSANARAFGFAIEQAKLAVQQDLTVRIESGIKSINAEQI